MRVTRMFLSLSLIVVSVACTASGGVEPIVIDLSAKRTPTPTPGIVLAPTPPPGAPEAAPPPAPAPRPIETAVPVPALSAAVERVTRAFEDAYNRRDAAQLAALFAPDAQISEPPDRIRDSGVDQIRQTFARRFASGAGTLRTTERFTQGNFVVERQTESGAAGPPSTALVISEIRDGRIVRVWILR